MDNTFEVKKSTVCNGTESQCIIAQKVCDVCTQRDCLSPLPLENSNLIDSAHSCEDADIIIPNGNGGITIAPGEQITLPLTVDVIKLAGKFTVCDCKILNVEALGACGVSKQGYWKISLNFKFCFPVEFYANDVLVPITKNGQTIYSICACTSFQKTVVLYGGEVCKCNDTSVDVVFCNNLYVPCGPYSNEKPFVLNQAEACLLQLELGLNETEDAKVINPTIGLFCIIKTYRISNMLVESSGDCLVEEEPCQDFTENPCEFFNSLDFPFKDFDPTCPAPPSPPSPCPPPVPHN